MTSSYESYSRAGADEPDVGIPNILKRILRISLPARAVNRGPALFGANHGQLFPNPVKEGLRLSGSHRVVARIEMPSAVA
jgi:hypothetical protein